MRYRAVISRVQIAERTVRAVSEELAIQQIQTELERPYGLLGAWKTVNSSIEVVDVTGGLSQPAQAVPEAGKLRLSIKEAASHLGIPYGSLYELVNTSEIQHVAVGRRKYISQDHLKSFIGSHTRLGWQGEHPPHHGLPGHLTGARCARQGGVHDPPTHIRTDA